AKSYSGLASITSNNPVGVLCYILDGMCLEKQLLFNANLLLSLRPGSGCNQQQAHKHPTRQNCHRHAHRVAAEVFDGSNQLSRRTNRHELTDETPWLRKNPPTCSQPRQRVGKEDN